MKLVLVLFFHGTPWKASSLENTPWNSMEIHVLILHGIHDHGKYSNEFHRTPWNSMEIHVPILHGIPWKIFHQIPWNSTEFHGGILHGTRHPFTQKLMSWLIDENKMVKELRSSKTIASRVGGVC